MGERRGSRCEFNHGLLYVDGKILIFIVFIDHFSREKGSKHFENFDFLTVYMNI